MAVAFGQLFAVLHGQRQITGVFAVLSSVNRDRVEIDLAIDLNIPENAENDENALGQYHLHIYTLIIDMFIIFRLARV